MKFNEFGSVQTFPPGVELFKQDEPVKVIYFIRDGVIKLAWADADGEETIVGLRWSGWFLGAAARIAEATNPVTAVTLVESSIESASITTFDHLIESNYEFNLIHQSHSLEILEFVRTVGEFGCLPSRSRLKSLLARLVSSVGEKIRLRDGRLRLPLKHKGLAAIIGVSPGHLSRVLRQLAMEHIVDLEDRWIIVQNPEKLLPVDRLKEATNEIATDDGTFDVREPCYVRPGDVRTNVSECLRSVGGSLLTAASKQDINIL